MSNSELFAIAFLIFLLLIALGVIGLLGCMLYSMRNRLTRYQGIVDVEVEQATGAQHDHLQVTTQPASSAPS
ncbi:MAG TPA: hypothetical protein VGD99_29270 [Anaerolineae bacterium]|jgi:hypothetical protein